MHGLISANNVNNPRVGWFSPSCEVHGISGLIQERVGFLRQGRLVQCLWHIVNPVGACSITTFPSFY